MGRLMHLGMDDDGTPWFLDIGTPDAQLGSRPRYLFKDFNHFDVNERSIYEISGTLMVQSLMSGLLGTSTNYHTNSQVSQRRFQLIKFIQAHDHRYHMALQCIRNVGLLCDIQNQSVTVRPPWMLTAH
jgi:hypothetical protein